MIRAAALLVVVAFAAAALSASEHSKQNANLPMVNAAASSSPSAPTWRLYTTCPGDRRNVPIVQERSA